MSVGGPTRADFWQHGVSAEANRQLHAGATCALLPKKHQSAFHRPDNPVRSTGDTGGGSYNTLRQREWKNTDPTAEYRQRGTGRGQSNPKGWNQSTVVDPHVRNPGVPENRAMERSLSTYQAVPQYEYNFRGEVLPKAEIKGGASYDKFHLDVSQGPAAALQKSSTNFNGFSEADVGVIGAKGSRTTGEFAHRGGGHYNNHSSNTTKQELPVHPNLREHHNIWNQGGDGDWKVSTDTHTQAARHERQAAADALAKTSAVSSKTTKMTMTQGRDYKGPQQVEDERIEKLRSLKKDATFDWKKLHTYRMPGGPDEAVEQEPEEDEWDGEITFAKRRPGGVQTRTRWNYAAPT